MRESKEELDLRLTRLDRSLDSIFLQDLDSVLKIIEDLKTYFFGVIVKLKTWAELMDPMKEHSIEDYLALLSQESDFKSFMRAGMENCTCKRCDKKDPLKPYLPCWCQHPESSDETLTKKFDDDCPKTFAVVEQSDTDVVYESSTSERTKSISFLKFEIINMIANLKRQYDERWHYPPKLPPTKTKYVACGKVPFYGHNDKPDYRPCWQHPLNVPNQALFGVCWEYPPERYKRRPLPPPCRGSTIPVHLLKPTFKHCENIYTRYDFKLEECVHEQILVVDQKLKKLKNQLAKAKPLQIKKVKEMRYHGVRYRILVGSTGCTKIYPEYLSRMTEERELCEFQRAYNIVNQSK